MEGRKDAWNCGERVLCGQSGLHRPVDRELVVCKKGLHLEGLE